MSRRSSWLVALVLALAFVATACGGGDGDEQQPTGATGQEGEAPVGGTLRLALVSDVTAAFDPQKEYYSVAWEFYRCCLLRTLMSFNGQTTEEGGN